MFKPAKWRSEKNKIKGVFKLQFHGTQLALLGGDDLMISLVPADVGKPTSRLEKAKVQDGNFYWEKPLYETVKFFQDPKTGKFHEKLYHFVLTKDASRFGDVGVVSIDFASYAEATNISSLSLPLKNANSAAVLHVSIQRLHGTSDQRDIDKIENVNHQDVSLWTHFINDDIRRITEDYGTCNGFNRDHQASIGSDIVLSSSVSSSALNTLHKHEPNNLKLTHEYFIKNNSLLQWDLLNDSAPMLSTDDLSTSTLGKTFEESSSDIIIQNLKVKVAALTRQADVSGLELQTLRKKIVNEMKKGRDISREVATLKEERNALKEECEKLKVEEVRVNSMSLIDQGDPYALLGELRQELVQEKDLSSNLRLQLQETQKSNDELLLALEMSKSKSKSELICCKSEMDNDEEQRELEAAVREHNGLKKTHLLEQKIINLYGEIEFIKKDKDDLEMQMEQMALDYEIIKQENQDLSFKLERSQLQEELTMQCECMSCTTVDELETEIESLENDLKSKSKEMSKSNIVIKELESHIKNLEEELENQGHEFETDLQELMLAKTNQEKRAIRAENNLRKVRLQNVNAATRLQEELKRLSQKMASTFEINEKTAMEAIDAANQLRVEKRVLEDTLMKVKTDLQDLGDRFQEKLVFLENQVTLKSKQLGKVKKKIENMTKVHNLEIQRLKELATDCSENLFLHKEKDLQLEVEEMERKLDVLVLTTEKPQ